VAVALKIREEGVAPSALVGAWALLGVIIALLLFILYMSFVPGLPTEGGWTLDNWRHLHSAHFLFEVLPNSIVLGLGSVLIAALFGVPIAWLLNCTDLPLRHAFITLVAVVLVIPSYVKTMGWIMLLDEKIGLVNVALAYLFDVQSVPISVSNNILGVTWAMGLMLVPAMFFLVAGPIRSLDPSLQEAARMSGAGLTRIFWRIELPLIWPSILGALIYLFITAISIFEVPALLTGGTGKVPVLATELFYAIRPAGPQTSTFAYGVAGVYGLVLAVPCLIAMMFYLQLFDHSDRYQVITGKAYRAQIVSLSGPARWLSFAFVVFFFCLSAVLPFLVLLWASLLPVLQMPSIEMIKKITLENYDGLLSLLGGVGVLTNTAILVLSVAGLVTFFSLLLSWIVVRTRYRHRKMIDVLSMLPHAIPSLAFAFALAMLGILMAVKLPWLPLAGTLAIIVIANVIARLPYGTRMANAAFLQVNRDLEEAAHMSGAGARLTATRILLPLIKPSAVYLAVWTGLLTMQEVSMALFLWGPENTVLSVSIFQLWTNGLVGPACAATVVLTLFTGALTLLILRFSGGAIHEAR
jgi:iron(III) transport system permease protein